MAAPEVAGGMGAGRMLVWLTALIALLLWVRSTARAPLDDDGDENQFRSLILVLGFTASLYPVAQFALGLLGMSGGGGGQGLRKSLVLVGPAFCALLETMLLFQIIFSVVSFHQTLAAILALAVLPLLSNVANSLFADMSHSDAADAPTTASRVLAAAVGGLSFLFALWYGSQRKHASTATSNTEAPIFSPTQLGMLLAMVIFVKHMAFHRARVGSASFSAADRTATVYHVFVAASLLFALLLGAGLLLSANVSSADFAERYMCREVAAGSSGTESAHSIGSSSNSNSNSNNMPNKDTNVINSNVNSVDAYTHLDTDHSSAASRLDLPAVPLLTCAMAAAALVVYHTMSIHSLLSLPTCAASLHLHTLIWASAAALGSVMHALLSDSFTTTPATWLAVLFCLLITVVNAAALAGRSSLSAFMQTLFSPAMLAPTALTPGSSYALSLPAAARSRRWTSIIVPLVVLVACLVAGRRDPDCSAIVHRLPTQSRLVNVGVNVGGLTVGGLSATGSAVQVGEDDIHRDAGGAGVDAGDHPHQRVPPLLHPDDGQQPARGDEVVVGDEHAGGRDHVHDQHHEAQQQQQDQQQQQQQQQPDDTPDGPGDEQHGPLDDQPAHLSSNLGAVAHMDREQLLAMLPKSMRRLANRELVVQKMISLRRQIADLYMKNILPNQPVALVGVPYHWNLGDSFIWLGQKAILDSLGLNVVFTCFEIHCSRNLANLTKVLGNGTIVVSGGGNYGDLYRFNMQLLYKLTNTFVNNRIVQLPQSIYYETHWEYALPDLRTHFRNPGFRFFVRDQPSYDHVYTMMEKNLSSLIHSPPYDNYLERLIRCPDSAIAIGPVMPNCEPSVDVVFLSRRDGEKVANASTLRTLFRKANVSVSVVDWMSDWRYAFPMPLYQPNPNTFAEYPLFRLHAANNMLCRGRVVVSDRLHASILSLLMGKPFVGLDNVYRKVRTVTNMLFHDESFGTPLSEEVMNFYLMETEQEVVDKVVSLLAEMREE